MLQLRLLREDDLKQRMPSRIIPLLRQLHHLRADGAGVAADRPVHGIGRACVPSVPAGGAAQRDLRGALSACQTFLDRSGDPFSRSVPGLVGLLVGHVGRVRAVQALAEEGLSARDAAARLKRHPFYVEKLYAQARNYSVDDLRTAVVRLAELDHAVKGGSRLAVDLELERALVDLTRAADAAAA